MAMYIEFRVEDDPEPIWICFYSTLHYRLADGSTLHIEQEAAWCEQCRSFTVAEVVPTIEELRERIQELQTPTQIHYFLHGTDQAIQDAIDELRVRVKWRESRKSPARCLTCGSTLVEPIRLDENRSCVIRGKRVIEVSSGFACTAHWVAVFSSEGDALPTQ